MPKFSEPYGYNKTGLPCTDFNRELCPPGIHPEFPDGAVGIRVDDDFWVVATLPWSYSERSIQQIVAELWPKYLNCCSYNPDTYVTKESLSRNKELAERLEQVKNNAQR